MPTSTRAAKRPGLRVKKNTLVSQETKAHTSAVPLSLPNGRLQAYNGATRPGLLPQGVRRAARRGSLPGGRRLLAPSAGSLKASRRGTRPRHRRGEHIPIRIPMFANFVNYISEILRDLFSNCIKIYTCFAFT